MHTGPAKPVAKKRREVLLWLRHPLFVQMKLSLPYRSPKKMSKFFVPPPRWSVIPTSLRVSFCSTVPVLSLSTRRKLAHFDGERRGAELWEKNVRVAAVRSSACSVCSRLLVPHCVCEKEGGKNSASRHTREKPAPWHSNQLTRFVIVIGPRKPKGGCWEVFGVWRHLTTPSRFFPP